MDPKTPLPATLTLAQRYHFDAQGFVLLEGVLTPDEVTRMKAALYRLRDDPEREQQRVYTRRRGSHFTLFGNLVEYDPALLEYAVHPRLVPLVEEVVGGAVRLEETEAILNRRNPDLTEAQLHAQGPHPTGFHTGARCTWGGYYENHRFHSLFVKTLAYLTDVGPDDGGTTLIPGSHRMTWPQAEMIEAAREDPRLIHQVEARAGSVLLFPETLVHSSTEIRSDRERVILISGYTPPMLREWMGNEVSPEFIARQPEALRPLLSGSDQWNWKRRY